MTIHEWPNMTSGEAYDKTQYDDNVNAGDIIVLDKIVGFLYSAWPSAVTLEHGELHQLKTPGNDLNQPGDEVDYNLSYAKAIEIANQKG